MTYEQLITIISSVGFPIVMCGVIAWFFKWYVDKVQTTMQASIDALRVSMDKQTDKLIELISKIEK